MEFGIKNLMYVDLILQNKGMKIGESVSKKFYNFTEKKIRLFS